MVYFEAGEWPVSYAGTGCSSFENGDADVKADFEEIATTLLWNWTNRVFGTRTETIRPQRVITPRRPSTFEGLGPASAYYELGGGISGAGWLPAYGGSSWLTLRCGRCGSIACSCDPNSLKAIHLPGPVTEVTSILIDGAVLSPSAYRVDSQHLLIRQDGETWPTAQDLIEPTTEVGTWSITFSHGVAVPKGGQLAAGLLACELFKAYSADPTCGLPARVKTVARQGVTVGIMDTFEGLDEGKTGLWAVDSWIASSIVKRDYVGFVSPDTRTPGIRSAFSVGYRP